MATLYRTIYTRAIAEINDPYITSAYENNMLNFFKIMYNYLNNAIPLFNTPTSQVTKLSDRTEPTGYTELFDGDGVNCSFKLSTVPSGDYFFYCTISDEEVESSFDVATNTVTLASTPTVGVENVSIEWYDVGQFNQTLTDQEQNILACFTVCCWAEKEKNFLMDIRRLLNDTDFKLYSESTSVREKGTWYYSMREKVEKLMMQYAWNFHITSMKSRYNINLY